MIILGIGVVTLGKWLLSCSSLNILHQDNGSSPSKDSS